ncbi:hypothetical protein [Kribbella sp. NPDC006257]|uniref:hypothetical protein n=1 Tax=Kribbella sp. NPDC006257 TaxID=3156738 RepID=UPI0033A1CFEA
METSAKRIGRMIATVLCSFLVALGVGVVAALVADRTRTCSSSECEDSLPALAVLMISLAVVPVIVLPIVASLARLGLVFVAGSTVALALIGIGTFGLAMGWYLVFYPLGVAVLVVTIVLANRSATPFPRHRSVVVAVLGFALVSAAAIPLIVKVDDVRTEQRAITRFAEKPLQPEWTDTWPFSVKSTDGELFYMVLQAPDSRGDRVADTEVTIRPGKQPDVDTPCRMFTDLVAGGARGCTEIQSQVWRADDNEGKPHFWVRGDGQWAHVTSSNFVENKVVQDERNSRAEQVARELRPRSAWRLGASAAGCGFCGWFG